MRKSLDSHYVNSLLQREWSVSPREYERSKHSINEKDIIKVETTDYGRYSLHTIYCNPFAGQNNFYDYILANWGPLWEEGTDKIKIIPVSLPKGPYFSIEVQNPDGDDMLGDYGYTITIDFPYGPYIVCWEDSSANFEPSPFLTGVETSTYVINFHGTWVVNPGNNF